MNPSAIADGREVATEGQASMFTMTLYRVGRTQLVQGNSRTGEEWEDTLIRLHRSTLSPNDPPRRVVYMTYHAAETGSPTNLIVLGHGDRHTDELTDPPMLISTDPPQF